MNWKFTDKLVNNIQTGLDPAFAYSKRILPNKCSRGTGITGSVDYHEFVDRNLEEFGMRIELITEDLMKKNIRKFSKFVNDAFAEYYQQYKWRKYADDNYLLNPLKDKFKFSFCIFDSDEEIRFLNFTSVLDGKLNNHLTFASKNTRRMNLAKYHIIKLCQTGLDCGYEKQVGYWPKINNGSIILYLRMGWEAASIKDDGILIMQADNAEVIRRAYKLLTEKETHIMA